jgi:serine/threonine protein kinase
MTPEIFGDYLLTSKVTERSMAEVFLAVKLGDRVGQPYVLKRAPLGERSSGAIAESLRREADVLRGGRVDGVVALADEGEVGGLPYVVLEHVRGVPLSSLLKREALDAGEVTLVARDLARIIGTLHERGWVHGDIAPSNVLVDEGGELTLIDLGLARRIGEARETPAGKPGYASPEAALGKDAAQSDDIYGWGVVVAECALGAPLFAETDVAEAAARSAELPSATGEVPKLKEALGLDARLRPSAAEIVAAIEVPPGVRPGLASRVTSFDRAPASRPPVSRAPRSSRETMPVATARATDPLVEKPKEPATAKTSWQPWAILGLSVVLALLLGFFVGKRNERATQKTSLTLPMLPARAEIELDGKRMLVPEQGRAIPIEPGRHELTVSSIGKGEREYEFVAEPGDHVVIVTVRMPNASSTKPRTKKR